VKDWLNTDGKALKLEDLKGKVVVLDFWGTWCPPCRAAMPHLKELYHKHKDDGLVVIGIHTTNGGEKMEAFVKEQKLDWPIALDVDAKTVKAFHVDSYPDYYLIDRAGNLRVADLVNGDLDRAVGILLKEKADTVKLGKE
jgi:thiol-disulfide isomerase/thioredoxin